MNDIHSFARPDEAVVRHLALDLAVDFERQILSGSATLSIDVHDGARELVLDTNGLTIDRVTLDDGSETTFALGDEQPYLGRSLTIAINAGTKSVKIEYASSPEAAAVQWLTPAQTAGGKDPFLFTQSQAILARTWVPCQDTPGVRMTYEATIRVPRGLMAVMSAENPTEASADGVYHFKMPQPIPSYLLALAVGDLAFRSLGRNSGVYAEKPMIEASAYELADTQKMIDAAERIYGPYRWGQYDVLVLPPSFPFGGMENPRLTFATPTILAGDRSLVSLVAHELAHSWSGNLVTNATWNDFWLNEGFTVYFERRIMEEVAGREYSEMLALLGYQDLEATVAELPPRDTHLFLDLTGRDPDEAATKLPYEKGYSLLRLIEESVGREAFDKFLRAYFDRHAFQSMTTSAFVAELREQLLSQFPGSEDKIGVEQWIHTPGIPENAPQIKSDAFTRVEDQVEAFQRGTPAGELATKGWSTHEWIHFLRHLPKNLTREQMAQLDAAFHFTDSGNSEVLHEWLMAAIEHRYETAYDALERFLLRQGRRKFLKPLYQKLAETPEGLERAGKIYAKARPTYHSVSYRTIDQIVK
ncbi:MAG: M1 family metallopeptidase [Acidobacteria bacterium]|nr:M1 family metallopeptidase [Acidobacteriota bacterium]MBV9477124.1 M1 family metallopeptidase [Acidobacteriota bacterium]